MILRKFQLQRTLLLSLHLLTAIAAQDGRTYDENEWIPIAPSNPPDKTKKAEGRVLNLEAPNQNYFAHSDYVGKRPPPQQYLQETSFQKGGNVRQPRPQPYKFEPVLPLQQPQYLQQNQFVQKPVQPQFIQNVPYVQTLQQVQQIPPPEQPISQQLVAPPQSTQNYYDANKGQAYEARPLNNTYLQAQNLAVLNQELIGAIQNQNINQNVKIQPSVTTKTNDEKENVQLLYVPLESLQSSQPVTQQTPRLKPTEVRREKQLPRNHHKLNQLTNIEDDFIRQALAAHKLQQQFKSGQPVLLQESTTTTTERPKKRKPNQPPLAVYMEKEGAAEVKDVLEVLKQAKSISVQDSAGPNSPKVFVGPSNIDPEGYVKFPLPYLSSVQGNRIERKVENLPFFVAPLSYKTPEGYSKIPLPSPHVGSVVVSTKNHEKQQELRQPQAAQNQIVPDFDVKQPFSSLGNQPKENSYLVNQNGQLPSSSNLFGFGNEYLGGFPNTPQQNYEVSSSKGFANDYDTPTKAVYEPQSYDEIPSYQVGERDNSDQYYQTTPSYKPTERPNIRSTYQTPDYDNSERELPSQDSKETIPNYDIPSVPVESKTSFTPNYQVDQQQVNQFPSSLGPSYATQKSPANVYNLNDAPIRQSTTTEALPDTRQNQFKLVQNPEPEYNSRGNSGQDPFRQVNQYEIEQINNQFREDTTDNVESLRSTTPTVVSTRRYQDTPSPTARGRSRTRHRGRTTTTSTTPNAIPEENYTVLEEFAVQPKSSTPKYTTEVETIPAKVYKLEPEAPTPVFLNQPPLKPQNLNQEILDQQILRGTAPPSNPSNVEFNQQLPYSHTPPRPTIDYTGQLTYSSPSRPPVNFNHELLQTTPSPKPVVDFNHEISQSRVPSRDPETERPLSEVQDPRLTPLVYNRGQEQQEENSAPVNPYLPGLINNLQNQGVKSLLVPNRLVPTTEKFTTIPPQFQTEEVIRVSTTTTESPRIETTTQRRTRGRQRAHTSRSSTTSTPRRASNRRRPSYTRPTTERQYTRATTEATEYEPTRRTSSQRQRFRTRGRPVQKEQPATERVLQTTENVFKQPALEGGFQGVSGDPESYMQFDHVVQNQQVVTARPEETPMKEYHQVYSLPPQSPSTERAYEEIGPTTKPVVDVKITHPVSDRSQEPVVVTTPRDDSRFIRVNNNIQSGGVIYNRNEEVTSRAPVRTRGRSRSRTRVSSTTPRTTTTTTPKLEPQEEEQDDFYGFIRKPNFNQPASLVQTTTEQSSPVYSASYQQSPRTLIQLEEDAGQAQNYESSNAPESVQFVGQLRPKYTTTETPEYSTEAPKIRPRARIRIPNRKVTPQHQSYNEVKPQRLDDQVTRRSSVVRSRSRGKSHYKLPENLKEKNDDHDVEGGNYPASYLKQRQLTTDKPASFQITIDPSDEQDEDQVPHSSLYSPQIIRNTETQWVEASIVPNDLEIEDKQMFVTSSEEQTTVPIEPTEPEQIATERFDEFVPTIPEEETATKPEEEMPVKSEENNPVKPEEDMPIKPEEDTPTTEAVETTTEQQRKMGRRRGVWKLVKHRAIDPFETAESQNYYSVLNDFDNIGKVEKNSRFVDETTTTTTTTTTTPSTPTSASTKRHRITTTTENGIFEALYSMLGFASKASQVPQTKTKVSLQKEITTTTVSPTFPEEITEETTEEMPQKDENETYESTITPEITTIPITTSTTTETSVKNYDVEPWDTREVKTSTSTEVSHETEICYKGKCIKSKDDKRV